MRTTYYVLQLIISALVVVDMFRRPQSAWAAADRQRPFWAGIVGVAGVIGAGLFAVVAYALLVFPRLQRGAGADPFPVSEAFRKA